MFNFTFVAEGKVAHSLRANLYSLLAGEIYPAAGGRVTSQKASAFPSVNSIISDL
jgi:hypothetical protein